MDELIENYCGERYVDRERALKLLKSQLLAILKEKMPKKRKPAHFNEDWAYNQALKKVHQILREVFK